MFAFIFSFFFIQKIIIPDQFNSSPFFPFAWFNLQLFPPKNRRNHIYFALPFTPEILSSI